MKKIYLKQQYNHLHGVHKWQKKGVKNGQKK